MTHAEDQPAKLACYRYKTEVLVGPWRRRPERALDDAVAAGQAWRNGGGRIYWRLDGEIETSPCDSGPCGGVYPPE